MTARTIMVQGTASSVGKTLLVAGLCRWFRQTGLRVAPFKAQNMSLNAYVTLEGREIGRAQAVQAEAAGVIATVDMNPILLKPEGQRSQVVVLGRPLGRLDAAAYHERKLDLRVLVAECLGRLRQAYDVVVIEGAGSPAEVNLRDRDLVNMHVAQVADAPVLLAGDIDRGGVFAALVGTMELLEPADRRRVAAFVINKFRGDVQLLRPGLEFLEQRTGVPVLGVVPFIPRLRLPDEDSASLDARRPRRRAGAAEIEIAVVRLPHIANFDDVMSLEHEPGVCVRFVDEARDLAEADLVVVPGSKSTMADLRWLREQGLDGALRERAAAGGYTVGVCGGCQMLGERIEDPEGAESTDATEMDGVGLLPLRTRFASEKRTARVVARVHRGSFFAGEIASEARIAGYEIHMGRTETSGEPAFHVVERDGRSERQSDGAVSASGAVVGTMIHGLFEDDAVRAALLRALRKQRGLPAPPAGPAWNREAEYDRLAHVLRDSLGHDRLEATVGLAAGSLARTWPTAARSR
jgi:adenosylcobyric acid synthase